MSKGKLILIITLAVLVLVGSLGYYMYTLGAITLPSKKEVSQKAEEVTEAAGLSREEPIVYSGSVIAIYVEPEITPEDMKSYAEYFGGVISDSKNSENGYYEITLKDTISSEDAGHFLEEVRNHIAVSEVYFIK